MGLIPKLSFKKRKKASDPQMETALQEALSPYLKKGELREYIRRIERDEEKKRLWDSMSTRTKIKLLRYVASKKEGKSE